MTTAETTSPRPDLLSAWLRLLEVWTRPFGAPGRLDQAINPGWVFGSVTVNNVNSRDPDIERRIVEEVSYGRQLGRIMDALAALVAQADPDTAPEEVKRQIDQKKA